ncbi:MAG: hypothetical protein K2X37_08220 [Chitinophagaceae bacterium]|nr:hypothetical protein [Chitinophagaceae bacterium]
MEDLDTAEFRKELYAKKDSIMEESDLIDEEDFRDHVDQMIKNITLMQLANVSNRFAFLAYRVGDSVYKKINQLEGYPLITDIFDLKNLRRHRIDSVYYQNKLRIDSSTLNLNLNNHPDAKVTYAVNFTDSIRNILGYTCSLVQVIEKKSLFLSGTKETLVEENKFEFFVTKAIEPNVPVEGVEWIYDKALTSYSALGISMFRSNQRFFQYEAIKIID